MSTKILTAVAVALSLCTAPTAYADDICRGMNIDDCYLYTMMREGVIVGDPAAALANVAGWCGRYWNGEPAETIAAEIDQVEPGLDYAHSMTVVLTAIQIYCPMLDETPPGFTPPEVVHW